MEGIDLPAALALGTYLIGTREGHGERG